MITELSSRNYLLKLQIGRMYRVRRLFLSASSKSKHVSKSGYSKSEISQGIVPAAMRKEYESKVHELRKKWIADIQMERLNQQGQNAVGDKSRKSKKKDTLKLMDKAVEEERRRQYEIEKNTRELQRQHKELVMRMGRKKQEDYYLRMLRLMAKYQHKIITKENIETRLNEDCFYEEVQIPGFDHPPLEYQFWMKMEKDEVFGMLKGDLRNWHHLDMHEYNQQYNILTDPNTWRLVQAWDKFRNEYVVWKRDGSLNEGRCPFWDLYQSLKVIYGENTVQEIIQQGKSGTERWLAFCAGDISLFNELEERIRLDGHYKFEAVEPREFPLYLATISKDSKEYDPELDKIGVLLRHINKFPLHYGLLSGGHYWSRMINLKKDPEAIANEFKDLFVPPTGHDMDTEDEFLSEEEERLLKYYEVDEKKERPISFPTNLPPGHKLKEDEIERMRVKEREEEIRAMVVSIDDCLRQVERQHGKDADLLWMRECGINCPRNASDEFKRELMIKKIAYRFNFDRKRLKRYMNGDLDIEDLDDEDPLFSGYRSKVDPCIRANVFSRAYQNGSETLDSKEDDDIVNSPGSERRDESEHYLSEYMLSTEDEDPVLVDKVAGVESRRDLANLRRMKRLEEEFDPEKDLEAGIPTLEHASEAEMNEGEELIGDTSELTPREQQAHSIRMYEGMTRLLQYEANRHAALGGMTKEEFMAQGLKDLTQYALENDIELSEGYLLAHREYEAGVWQLLQTGLWASERNPAQKNLNEFISCLRPSGSLLDDQAIDWNHIEYRLKLTRKLNADEIDHLDTEDRKRLILKKLEENLIGPKQIEKTIMAHDFEKWICYTSDEEADFRERDFL